MSKERQGLDAFTKRYLFALLIVAAAILIWWISSLDSRVSTLNSILQADSRLAEYPYHFEVISLKNGVAEIASPRSAQVPAMKFLRIVYPELQHASAIDVTMMDAQDALASVQSHAGKLISSQKGVQSIRWSIDRKWYAYHGIYLD